MNLKKWLIIGLNTIMIIVLLVLKFTLKDFPQWAVYIFIGIVLLLMIFYRLEMSKDVKKNEESLKEKEKERRKAFISMLEEKSEDNSTIHVMYELFTNQILEIEALIKQKELEIEYDWDEADTFEVDISSKHKKNKQFYYLALSIDEEEEELLTNDGKEIDTQQMKESEIIDLIINDINKF
ncbi:MAG: hypothetical protein K2I88_04175 [Anaeroplasmataceae bacterium]|nr:hypothetical protein [Anaeroplasmataceae bacterium]